MWMKKLVLIHGGIKTGEEDQVLEFNEIHADDGSDSEDDDLTMEDDIEFEGYDLDKLNEENKKKKLLNNHEGDADTAIEIESITDAETGEVINFEIDG